MGVGWCLRAQVGELAFLSIPTHVVAPCADCGSVVITQLARADDGGGGPHGAAA
jgi:hypothetical protein